MLIKNINELQDYCELYDNTFETRESAYEVELSDALDALRDAAPAEYAAYMYYVTLRQEYQKRSDSDLTKLENEIKAFVKSLRQTWHARLHMWVFVPEDRKLKFDEVVGYIKAHHDDPEDYIETGKPSVTKRRVKN